MTANTSTSTSTSTAPDLRVAGMADIDQIADLIADAFEHLEVIGYLVPDPDRRRPVARDWYRLWVEHAIGGAGHVVKTADGIPAYLEATGQQNRRLYRRHGYTDMTAPAIPVADGISLHRMWHPAHRC